MALEGSLLPWVWVAIALLGGCIGSFLNVVVYRVPRGISVVTPPSACPGCSKRIAPWDNVPVLSWLLLRGRCRGCGTSISPRYVLVEAVTAALAVLCVVRFGLSVEALVTFGLLAALLAVALIDWEHMIIPDPISLGLLVVGLALAPWRDPGLWGALLGALAGGGLLLIVGVVWEKARGVEAMGGGDIKLMAAVGAFLGVAGVLLVIFVGAFLGALVGVVLLRRTGVARVAFGTFLSAAAFLVVFFGDTFLTWYLTRAGLLP